MEYASKSAEPKTAQADMSMELATYIDARRKWLMHEINGLSTQRKEIFERIKDLCEERDKINSREMEYAKELGVLNRIAEACGGQEPVTTDEPDAAPDFEGSVVQPRADAAPPEPPAEPDKPQDAQPDGLYIPEGGKVVYSLPAREQTQTVPVSKAAQDRRKKVQLCGATVAERRIREDLSYKQLANLTGIGLAELHDIVDNNAPTNPYKAQRLAFALCCTVGDLMSPPSQPAAAETEQPYSRIGV